MTGGHFSQVYAFSQGDSAYVLRVTPPNDEIGLPEMEAILAWVDFLASRGASVIRPVRSDRNRLVETVEEGDPDALLVVLTRASGVLAEELTSAQWGVGLIRELGRPVGRLHAISREYIPACASLMRPAWDHVGNCFHPLELLDHSQSSVAQRQARVVSHVQALPKDRLSYGLIHTDLHLANIVVDPERSRVTLLDFDDCSYGWFAMDTAMLLFDVAVLYDAPGRDHFSERFLRAYLWGYTAESPVSGFWLQQLPQLLKLLEIGVYAQLYRAYDRGEHDAWAQRFMEGRLQRIEDDVPYLAIDWGSLSADR